MVVYALGALPGDAQIETLQHGAAGRRRRRALERGGRARPARTARRRRPVLRQMLDRSYVEQTVKRDVAQDDDQDPIADVMISGLRAAAALKDDALKPTVERAEPAGPQHESARRRRSKR